MPHVDGRRVAAAIRAKAVARTGCNPSHMGAYLIEAPAMQSPLTPGRAMGRRTRWVEASCDLTLSASAHILLTDTDL
jgi:hypothetical protein